MLKVKSNNPAMKGRSIILPIVGKVEYNDKCEIEIEDHSKAEELVAIEELNLEIVGKKTEGSKTPSKEPSKDSASDVSKDIRTLQQLSKEELEKFFKTTKRGDLNVLASNLGIKEVEDLPNKAAVVGEIEKIIIKETTGESEGAEEPEEGGVSKEDQIEFINSLEKIKDLKELATGFPETEWKSIKSIAQFKEYLISKIQ